MLDHVPPFLCRARVFAPPVQNDREEGRSTPFRIKIRYPNFGTLEKQRRCEMAGDGRLFISAGGP